MKTLTVALALVVAAGSAAAQTYIYDQPMFANGGTLRPSQLWVDPTGQNDSDVDAIAWEDFQLTQDAFLTRVRWWGETAPPHGFRISFYNQDPGTIAVQPDIFAPGSGPILQEYNTNFTQTWVSGALYRFEVDLTTPLHVNANTRYFVSVVGQTASYSAEWRWAQSSSGPNGTFWWQRGLHMYFQLADSRAMSLAGVSGSSVGVPFCSGDGPGGPCPCGNAAALGAGCANSTGVGAVMSATGSASVSADDLVLTTTGMPAFQNCLDFVGASMIQGVPFGDVRRCVVGQISCFGIQSTGASGTAIYGPGLSAYSISNFPSSNRLLAGRTLGFQTWYRDPTGPCGATTNLSNAQQVVFVP